MNALVILLSQSAEGIDIQPARERAAQNEAIRVALPRRLR